MHKTKWGIIGSGNIANAFAHSIKYCKDSELISVFGRNAKSLDQFSTKFHIDPYTDLNNCLLYTSPSPRDRQKSRMPSSA